VFHLFLLCVRAEYVSFPSLYRRLIIDEERNKERKTYRQTTAQFEKENPQTINFKITFLLFLARSCTLAIFQTERISHAFRRKMSMLFFTSGDEFLKIEPPSARSMMIERFYFGI
jgi:hypothetical protein